MNLSVVIPYKEDGERRDEIFGWMIDRYKALLPTAQLCIGTNDDVEFSRAKAINHGYRFAKNDILLIADADTAFHKSWILQAIQMIKDGAPWVLPYSIYYNVNEESTEELLSWPAWANLPDIEFKADHALKDAVSGLIILTRESFELVKGFDERFVGWGYEDRGFQSSLDMMVGPHQRIEDGYAVHFYHKPGLRFESPNIEFCRNLAASYQQARTKEQMQMILDER